MWVGSIAWGGMCAGSDPLLIQAVVYVVFCSRQNYKLKLMNDDYKNQDRDAALKVRAGLNEKDPRFFFFVVNKGPC